jgi:hypothetical protein
MAPKLRLPMQILGIQQSIKLRKFCTFLLDCHGLVNVLGNSLADLRPSQPG